jgi:hypothetical protein
MERRFANGKSQVPEGRNVGRKIFRIRCGIPLGMIPVCRPADMSSPTDHHPCRQWLRRLFCFLRHVRSGCPRAVTSLKSLRTPHVEMAKNRAINVEVISGQRFNLSDGNPYIYTVKFQYGQERRTKK